MLRFHQAYHRSINGRSENVTGHGLGRTEQDNKTLQDPDKMESGTELDVCWQKILLSAGVGALVAGLGYLLFKTLNR